MGDREDLIEEEEGWNHNVMGVNEPKVYIIPPKEESMLQKFERMEEAASFKKNKQKKTRPKTQQHSNVNKQDFPDLPIGGNDNNHKNNPGATIQGIEAHKNYLAKN